MKPPPRALWDLVEEPKRRYWYFIGIIALAIGFPAVLLVTLFLWPGLAEPMPPSPSAEPDHLAADIDRLGADLTACLQRENDRLREQKADLDRQIEEALVEAAALAASAQPRRAPRR